MPENVLYFHSRCCEAHWELVWRDGKYSLECEICGNPVGNIEITGPDYTGCECEICKGKEENEKA